MQLSELLVAPVTGAKLPEGVKRLLPGPGQYIMRHEAVSFRLKGPLAFANALRRTIEAEVPVCRLAVTSFQSDDGPHIEEMLARRITTIPIRRSTKKTVFLIDVHNKLHTPIRVTTSDIRGAENLVNPDVEICTLNSQCHIRIELHLETHIGYVKGFCQYTYASCCVCVPYGVTSSLVTGFNPHGPAIGTGDRRGLNDGPKDATVRDATDHLIRFFTNGDIGARELIVSACDVLAERFQSFRSFVPQLHENGRGFTVLVPGECYTTAYALVHAINTTSNDIGCAYTNVYKSYQTRGHDKMSEDMEIVWSCRSDPREVWGRAIAMCLDMMMDIKHSVV